jgi:hypothetical protein
VFIVGGGFLLEIFMGCLRKVEFGEEIYGLSRILWEKGTLLLYGGFFERKGRRSAAQLRRREVQYKGMTHLHTHTIARL